MAETTPTPIVDILGLDKASTESPTATGPVEEKAAATPEAKSSPTPEKPAPVEYADFKLPEGVELEPEVLGRFKELASKTGISQEAAQSLVDLHTEQAKAIAEAASAANSKAWAELNEKWVNEVSTDKEVGGDNLASMKATVAKALDQYGPKAPPDQATPENDVRAALALTGAGNNPAIIKWVYSMAKALTEGGVGPAARPVAGVPKHAAEIMYPDLTSGVL